MFDIAREIIQQINPSAAFRSQSQADWEGDFPLPEAVSEYFDKFGPVDITIHAYGNPYHLPSLAKLWYRQTGYRIHGKTRERIADWDDDWLVIADEGGDPFIFSRSEKVILHAHHGEGHWQPARLFENLSEMTISFAIIGQIVAKAGKDLTGTDALILERYRQEAGRLLSEFLCSNEKAHAILARLGWN